MTFVRRSSLGSTAPLTLSVSSLEAQGGIYLTTTAVNILTTSTIVSSPSSSSQTHIVKRQVPYYTFKDEEEEGSSQEMLTHSWPAPAIDFTWYPLIIQLIDNRHSLLTAIEHCVPRKLHQPATSSDSAQNCVSWFAAQSRPTSKVSERCIDQTIPHMDERGALRSTFACLVNRGS